MDNTVRDRGTPSIILGRNTELLLNIPISILHINTA